MPTVADLAQVYDDHAQALFAFLLNFTRNEDDTRDVLQELFCKLAARPDLLAGVLQPRAFLVRLCHNLAVDLMRRRGARDRNQHDFALDTPEIFAEVTSDPDGDAFRQALTSALAELPSEQRAVVHLKLWEGWTFDAIGEALQIPLNTAGSRYRYGIDKLRERLRPLYDEIK
jgi:RNA polymerase sigma-70 factor (ECF subfamily)